jgi:DNA-binding NarL/FixJ family response regulator
MSPALEQFRFTRRQADVARLVAVGEPIKAIGARLEISPRTVEGFLTAIRRKTGTETTAQAGCKLARLLARVKPRA